MTECVAAHGCITCGDVATPMRVVKIDSERTLALCSNPRGERSSVEIALVEPVAPGELLLVHAGTALARAAEQSSDPVPLHGTGEDANQALVNSTGRNADHPPAHTTGREVRA
jgi:hydrogenase maturation factor